MFAIAFMLFGMSSRVTIRFCVRLVSGSNLYTRIWTSFSCHWTASVCNTWFVNVSVDGRL